MFMFGGGWFLSTCGEREDDYIPLAAPNGLGLGQGEGRKYLPKSGERAATKPSVALEDENPDEQEPDKLYTNFLEEFEGTIPNYKNFDKATIDEVLQWLAGELANLEHGQPQIEIECDKGVRLPVVSTSFRKHSLSRIVKIIASTWNLEIAELNEDRLLLINRDYSENYVPPKKSVLQHWIEGQESDSTE